MHRRQASAGSALVTQKTVYESTRTQQHWGSAEHVRQAGAGPPASVSSEERMKTPGNGKVKVYAAHVRQAADDTAMLREEMCVRGRRARGLVCCQPSGRPGFQAHQPVCGPPAATRTPRLTRSEHFRAQAKQCLPCLCWLLGGASQSAPFFLSSPPGSHACLSEKCLLDP